MQNFALINQCFTWNNFKYYINYYITKSIKFNCSIKYYFRI